ncbi:MAG: RNA polymerase sigma factor [Clostridiales Family XIII bacterium]|jgi:RNA polymerase sigma-70 factor (ECF subfamily)|nr:RNA polymerase sigma factor [Clostridiales Family XIII bacterium]
METTTNELNTTLAADDDLVARAMARDEAAFSELYKMKLPKILFHAYKILGNYHDAEEAAHEVIMLMYRKIGALHSPELLDAWMYRIVVNVCTSSRRGLKHRAVHVNDDVITATVSDDDRDFLPHECLESAELRERLNKAIDALPERQRMVIIFYYFDDMSLKQIGRILEIAQSTISTQLKIAKEKIRKHMDTYIRTEGDWEIGKTSMNTAATPVLAQILHEQYTEQITPEAIKSFLDTYGHRLPGGEAFKATRGIAKHSGIEKGLGATIAVAAIINLLVFVGVTTTPDIPAKAVASAAPTPGYTLIAENGGLCACGHVNPYLIELKSVDAGGGPTTWAIKDKNGATLYEGEGAKVTSPLTALYNAGAEGDYELSFTRTEDSGRIVRITQDFRIDIGEIVPGRYA